MVLAVRVRCRGADASPPLVMAVGVGRGRWRAGTSTFVVSVWGVCAGSVPVFEVHRPTGFSPIRRSLTLTRYILTRMIVVVSALPLVPPLQMV